VLEAMGLSADRARSSLRFSLHRGTSEEEIDRAIELVKTQVARMRELSVVTR
jgi:cysteine desulfurase